MVCSLSLNGAAAAGWMDEESREQGKGRPQSKLTAQRERSFVAQVGYDPAFISGWMALNIRSIPFGQNVRMRFMHAIQSFCKFPTDISAYGCYLILWLGLGLCT